MKKTHYELPDGTRTRSVTDVLTDIRPIRGVMPSDDVNPTKRLHGSAVPAGVSVTTGGPTPPATNEEAK